MASSGHDPREQSPASQTTPTPPLGDPHATGRADPNSSGHETAAERLTRDGQNAAEAVKQTGRAAVEAVGDKVEQYKDEAKSTFVRLADDAKARARSAVEGRKHATAQDLADVAEALQASADRMEQRDHSVAAGYVRQAAGGLEQVADSLERRDIVDLLRQTEDLARRQPGVFVGGAVIAGFALARFLKSSGERQRREASAAGTHRGFSPGPGGYASDSAQSWSGGGADGPTARTGADLGGGGTSGPGAAERRFTPTEEGNVHGNR